MLSKVGASISSVTLPRVGRVGAPAGRGTVAVAASTLVSPCDAPANAIVAENCLTGSPDSEWDVTGGGDPSLQGFATDISVNRGQAVTFKISTPYAGYRLEIYRLGYYGGTGARKVATVPPSLTVPQNQPACLTEAVTGLIDCGNWSASASWTVPGTATSGIYFAKVVRDLLLPGEVETASHIFFVVRDDSGHSDMLVQTSDETWQAYNRYGGNSLYFGNGATGRAYKVSYNRPVDTRAHDPQSFVFNAEYPMVRWLEANGYNVSYFTGVDSDRLGSEILEHKIFVSSGHDEYWSGAQRANVEAARNAGVHLAFFSGNEMFWKTRWEPSIDGSGAAYRTLVTYKETLANAKIDPSPEWTGTWRDPRFSPPADGGRPENAVTGTLFTVDNQYESRSIVVTQPEGKLRFWRSTSAAALAPSGSLTLPIGTLGYEWDSDPDNGHRPAGLIRLSSATYTVPGEIKDNGSTYDVGTVTHHLTMYRQGSALVFGAGTIQWAWGLDMDHDLPGTPASIDMQQATVNLLTDMGAISGSLQPGLVIGTASTDAVAPVSTIVSPAGGASVSTGSHTIISGTASDTGGLVAAVEVSFDNGASWHPATGGATWTYDWTPASAGSVVLKSRAVDDSGNVETPGAGTAVNVVLASATCPCTIWDATTTPALPSETNDSNQVELGTRFRALQDGFVTAIRFYKGPTNLGIHSGHLWTNSGTLLASVVFTGETATGWQRAQLTPSVAITQNTTYVVSYHAPVGNYAVDTNYFGASGFDHPPLRALRNGEDGANGVFVYGAAGTFPTGTVNGNNYWADVEFVPLNTAPAAANDTYTTNEDSTLTVAVPGVLANDSDVDAGTTLTAVLVSGPAHGTLALNGNGSFTYTPAANFNGADAFTYKANDGSADSNVATANITVTPVNDPPSFDPIADRIVAEDSGTQTLNITNISMGLPDETGQTVTLTAASNEPTIVPAPTISGTGVTRILSFAPAANANGTVTILVTADDGQAVNNTFARTFTITVTPVNDAPVAANDSYSTAEDTALTVSAPGVLGNDSDADVPTTLTATVVASPAHGALTLNTNGSFTYTPSAEYSGPDSFTYKASDGSLDSNVATVTLTVSAVNDAPVAVNDSYSMGDNTTLTVAAPGILGNDTDAESDALTSLLVSLPAHGALSLNVNGGLSYTPNVNYTGPDGFTYRASDGQVSSNVATVSISVVHVNLPPVVNAGSNQTITLPATASLAGTATDSDGTIVSVLWTKVSGPGTVTFANANALATTATFSASGAYVLSLTATDNSSASASASVTITVNPVAVNTALKFNGTNNRVTFGAAPALGAQSFTLETWFKREGPGAMASTGTGGVSAVPLITKGVAETDAVDTKDMNYFLGIDATRRVLAADFEDTATSGNHPVLGVTPICDNIWYHAAVTYDQPTGTWRLYLNGNLETQLVLSSALMPRFDSIQHAGLGVALNSTGVGTGAFQGTMDEPRIWNVVRTQSQIQAAMGAALPGAQAGLQGRWAMDEGAGTSIADSSGHGVTGTLVNFSGSFWVTGTPFVSTPMAPGAYGLHLTGTPAASDYVSFGAAPALDAASFTIETWFKRDGTGIPTSTGTGGLSAAIPLLTKGRADADGSNLDLNYFLGINSTTNVLAGDFEEGVSPGGTPGLNHPILGTTVISNNVWNHAALTYDGTTLRLYLNGVQEASIVVGRPTRFDSIEHAALGSALTSTGAAAGFFAGTLDEARIWNYTRSAAQIVSGKDREIATASGLLGRWSFNDGCPACRDSSGNNQNGTLFGSGWTWVAGQTFAGAPNAAPAVDAGIDRSIAIPPGSAALSGSVNDDNLSGAPLVIVWSKTSGPGTVSFANPNAAATSATFSTTGTYVLTLSANDGELAASDTMTVQVNGVVNQAPTVDAGPDGAITLPTTVVTLAGTMTDDGVPGTGLTSQWTKVSGPGGVTFGNAAALSTTATFSVAGSYVLQLAGSDGLATTTDTMTVIVSSNPGNKAVQFGGTNAYVTFGAAPGLGAAKFTLETWFRRDGAGVATNTGTGGVVAVPLITKGMAEADGSNVDMNYFLGIDSTTNKLVADFEDAATGLNHPASGATVIPADGAWRHVAATFDGTTWRLYLNGALETTLVVGSFTPRADSIQHAALATALNSAGVATSGQTQGFFNGVLDEARIWNYARSPQQIDRGRLLEISSSTPGLLARWGLNEGTGTSAADSSGHAITGTIAGTNWSWVDGAPFTGTNTAPVAVSDSANVQEDSSVSIAVLANDTDADGDAPLVTAVSAPSHGTATVNADGTVTYAPAANYNGDDSFTYTIADSQGASATGAVSVTVTALNDPPIAVNDSYTTGEDTTLTIVAPGLLVNDTDVDAGTTLTASLVASATHGTVTVNADGSFSYAPNADFNGTDSFTYKASDGTVDSNVATVTIVVTAVNDAPVAANDSYATDEDTALTIVAPGLLANDTDVDTGTTLTASLVANATHGTVIVNADGGFSYTPNANFNGTDSFTYKASDGTVDSNTATVTIAIAAVNDAPVALDQAVATDEDTATPITLAATDAEASPLTYAIVVGPAHGSLTGTAPSLTYTPAANYNGSDSFTFKANDGSLDSNVATVTIAIAAVNDAPVAVSDSFSATEDTTLTIAAPGVLANDTDADGGALTAVLVTGPANGSLNLNASGGFTYTPNANFSGSDSFVYRASDGSLTSAATVVSLTVSPVNDPPVVNAGADLTVTMPAAATLAGTAVDVDSTLTIAWTKSSGPGTVTFANPSSAATTATFSAAGTYVLALTAGDGQFNVTDTATMTVTGSNSALRFDGSTKRVTFGPAPGLGAATFTIETWFKREGTGLTASTGTGGLVAIPLVTKGVAQADGSNVDANYFLGINGSTRVLAADFEDTATGANHPVLGTTPICDNVWYHAAATYDGTTWRLYLNGQLETTLVLGAFTPRSDSIQHAGLAAAFTSAGVASGAFQGILDEPRIWNVARSAAQIQSAMTGPLTSAAGLIGRWGLDEATGTTISDSTGNGNTGTIQNGAVWIEGTPYVSTPLPPGNYGLHLTGTTADAGYVTFGAAPGLNAAIFTIETWFKRDGAGVSTSTGTGGVDAIPLVTKGRAEAEGSNVDMDYFLGINNATNTLAADFEEGVSTGGTPGLNHPVLGATAIQNNVWYHAAATYDGQTWRLYLNGVLDGSLTLPVARPPRSDSIQHAAVGSALNSTGVAAGFFAGTLDEVRIWNVVRTASQILSGKDQEIPAATGLLGRWGFNDACGGVIDSSGNGRNGTVTGLNCTFVAGAPFGGSPNAAPVVNAGSDLAITLPAPAPLAGSYTDDGLSGMAVTTLWSKTSGPGIVTFGNAAALITTASFSAPGTYVLTLTANDGLLSGSDTISITATGVGNQAPIVNAGSDQTITLPANVVTLSGSVTDDGLPGTGVTIQWTKVSGPGTVTFANAAAASTTATFSLDGSYVLQLSGNDGQFTTTDAAAITVNPSPANKALQFGSNSYVTFGAAPGLGASKFTIETWFRRDGAGVATNTGTGGVVAIPLVTKGMAETEGGTVDMNYFLGIRGTDSVLAADFEDTATGLNHPVAGTTAIPADGVWRHAAATYDGTTWRLYLNGALEATLVVGSFTPRFDSIQHAALATALNSTGVVTSGQTQGSFNGVLDEARIWSYARSTQQIGHGRTLEISSSVPGLLARWGLNEGSGTVVGDSSGHAIAGAVVGGTTWVAGAPFTGPANAAPVAVSDSATTPQNTAATIAVLSNDTDADGDALSVVSASVPLHGTAAINANGTIAYAPAASYSGGDSFTYTISDGQGGGATGTVNVTVTFVNTPPVANNDSYSTNKNVTLTIGVPGVLVNDTDADGDPLSAIFVSGPSHGTLTLNAGGSFTYTPAAGYTGPDSFTYKANDNTADSNIVSAGITVNATNTAPVAVNDNYATNEDATLTVAAAGVLANDTDVDGDALTAVLVSGPTHGTLALNANGSFSYTPAANYNGPDGFTYKARDAALDSNVASVAIAVNALNDPPSAANDGYSGTEDAVLTVAAPGPLGNDTDVDGDALTAVLVSGPAHGTLALNANGSFSYTPAADYNGPDSFTYRAGDGVATSNVATVSITLAPVNDAPAAANDSYSTSEDGVLTLAAPGVLGNDTDVDGDALTAILVSGPAHGTLTLNANGGFTYTPAANDNGPDSFTYKARDAALDSNVATVAITVDAVNDPPVAVNDGYTIGEDTTLTVAAPGVLGNDSDIDSAAITAIVVAGPAHGTLALNANGSFSYTPAANYNGSDSFTYKANDGAADSNVATVAIAVTAANDAPVAVNDSYSTNEDTALTIATAAQGVLGNDADVDGDALTVILVSGPTHGTLTLNANGSFTYTPAANYNGSDGFTYKANDGTADSNAATVTLTVNAVNDAPVALNDAYATTEDTPLTVAAPGVLGNDTDVESGALTAIVVAGPAHGTLTLNASGGFSYAPALNYNGSDSFTYKANDGADDSNVATVAIVVTAVNDAPVASNDAFSTAEDTAVVVVAPGLLANDTDAEGNPLTAILVSGPAHGTATLNANGSVTYTPATNYSGLDSFTYKANDGSADSNVATVTITITPTNDPPVAINDSYSTNEDTTLTVAAPGVLANDVDVDGDPLSAILLSSPTHGTLTLNTNGSLTYTPFVNYNGPDSFTYKARDGALDSNVATVSITVSPVNDPPVAVNDSFSMTEDTTLNVAAPGVLGNDSDVDGDALTAVVVAGPGHGTLTLGSNGTITYTPAANYNGPDSFTYKARDAIADSNVATVSITIVAVNDAPVANNDTFSTNEDTPLTVAAPGPLSNDTDVDSVALTASKVADPSHGTVTVNANGSFTYTPAANYNGPDSFTYMVSDGSLTSTATVSITVNAVNDAPVAANKSLNVNEDASKAIVLSATDVEGSPLTFVIVTPPAHGTLTGTIPNLTYRGVLNYNGPDSFTYKANDGTADSNIATVTITVNPVNDAPVAQAGSFTTPVNTRKNGQLIATDVDGNPLTYSITTQPTKGTVTVNASTGAFTYTPNTGATGADSFRFRARDGSTNSNIAVMSITIQ